FFFQAEDGIRDPLVTGVQTCALPIWALPRLFTCRQAAMLCLQPQCNKKIVALQNKVCGGIGRPGASAGCEAHALMSQPAPMAHRSEERRVGKECRSRWTADTEENKR